MYFTDFENGFATIEECIKLVYSFSMMKITVQVLEGTGHYKLAHVLD